MPKTIRKKLWKHLKRHPRSAEYRDITGPAWMRFTLRMKAIGFMENFPIYLHEDQVIDGWQRLRACIETNIEPVFAAMPAGMTPEDFVATVNDERRHETSEEREERIEARRKRVAEAREDGKSFRAIAEEEGIGVGTAHADADAPGVRPRTPDHANSVVPEAENPKKVTGIDGKTYPAKKPAKPLCPACEHRASLGRPLIEKCEVCAKLNGQAKKAEEKAPKNGEPKFNKDETFNQLHAKLSQLFDARVRATGAGPKQTKTITLTDNCHRNCLTLVQEIIETYKIWKKGT